MSDILDVDIENFLSENSPIIKDLLQQLQQMGININAKVLTTIIHEYEAIKFDFLKDQIMQLVDSGMFETNDPMEGPVKVIVSKQTKQVKNKNDLNDEVETHYIC